MQSLRSTIDIEDYTLQQTSLDDVFIRLAAKADAKLNGETPNESAPSRTVRGTQNAADQSPNVHVALNGGATPGSSGTCRASGVLSTVAATPRSSPPIPPEQPMIPLNDRSIHAFT